MTAFAIKSELKALSDAEIAKHSARFFMTGKGEYGEGDQFIGVRVPVQRKVAKKYVGIDLDEVKKLLASRVHEHRLTAVLILVYKYEKGDEGLKKQIFDFYLDNLGTVNNWDIVDSSAHKIVGDYLIDNPVLVKIIYNLARSRDLWERRVAMIATLAFIQAEKFEHVVAIAEILIDDEEDLIQKAVGWMLREMGKRNEVKLINFLNRHYQIMPRTALRYAIERLSSSQKDFFMGRA